MSDYAVAIKKILNDGLSNFNGTIRPGVAQGDEYPAIRYREISRDEITDLQTDPIEEEALFQIDAIAAGRTEAIELAKEIRGLLRGFRGTKSSVWFDNILVSNGPRLGQTIPAKASDNRRDVASIDYQIFFIEE